MRTTRKRVRAAEPVPHAAERVAARAGEASSGQDAVRVHRIELLLGYLLAVMHGLAITTLVFAPIAFWRSPRRVGWLEQLFLVVAGTTTASYLLTGECFLTVWEQRLRLRGTGEVAYTGGFVGHYLALAGIHWPDTMTRTAGLTLIVLAVSGLLLRWSLDRTRSSRV